MAIYSSLSEAQAAPFAASAFRVSVAQLGPAIPAGLVGGPALDVEAAWIAPDDTRWWGLGVAARLEAATAADAPRLADRARALVREATAACPAAAALLRCFGGVAFDPERPGHWPAAAFWLPACLVHWDGSAAVAVITSVKGAAETEQIFAGRHAAQLEAALERLNTPQPVSPLPRGSALADPEAAARWQHMTETVLAAIAAGQLVKAVPARGVALAFDALPAALPGEPAGLDLAFETLAGRSPGTDRLCLRPQPGLALLAASPELLFGQVEDRLSLDCLAGTAPRGQTAAQDAQYAEELLTSVKERHEHDVVVKFVQAALAPHGVAIAPATTPGLRRLATLQHLHTPLFALVDPQTPLETWFSALHPTPAVCGQPRAAALTLLRTHEDRPRGWYAGALGWVGAHEARFVVGLRAALFEGAEAWLPAGAGVVAGSRPALEWTEVERKLAPMRTLFEAAAVATAVVPSSERALS